MDDFFLRLLKLFPKQVLTKVVSGENETIEGRKNTMRLRAEM